MTHIPGTPIRGALGQPEPTTRTCRLCAAPMTHQLWESSCGGFEDSKFTCANGHVEWVDGIDS